MDKQVIDVLKDIVKNNNIQKDVMEVEKKLTNRINLVEKEVIKNTTNIEHMEKSMKNIEDMVGSVYNQMGKLNETLVNRLDRFEDKIDNNTKRFESINEELLVRRLISNLINKHPAITRTAIGIFIAFVSMMFFYYLSLFINS